MTMMNEQTAPLPAVDPIVLARLTGRLGDRETISKLCESLGEVLQEFLPDIFMSELGFEVAVSYAGFETGRYGQLVGGLGGAMAVTDCALRGAALVEKVDAAANRLVDAGHGRQLGADIAACFGGMRRAAQGQACRQQRKAQIRMVHGISQQSRSQSSGRACAGPCVQHGNVFSMYTDSSAMPLRCG